MRRYVSLPLFDLRTSFKSSLGSGVSSFLKAFNVSDDFLMLSFLDPSVATTSATINLIAES